MSVPSWTAALRIARREAWRGKLRSVLVIALVGLPVLVISGADVLYQTYTLSPVEQVSRIMGAADAQVQWAGGGVVSESPGSSGYLRKTRAQVPNSPAPPTAQLAAHLPAGTRILDYRTATSPTNFYSRDGVSSATLIGLNYADPIAAGMVRQDSGRAPRTTHEVAITQGVAASAGLGVGDVLRTVGPKHDYRIVGVVTDRNWYDADEIYTVPSSVAATAGSGMTGDSSASWLIDTPRAVTTRQASELQQLGYATLSRAVYLAPTDDGGQSPSTQAVATSTLIGGMVLLEIVLLAGPAFAVGARRRSRELALLAAVGGDRAALRRVVLADAVVLGVTAGVFGALGGIGLGALVERWTVHIANKLPGAFDVPYLHLAGLVVVSLITALLAALAPAIRAARTDVVAALAGRRGVTRIRPHVPIVGLVLVALGVAITLGAFVRPSADSLLAGVALVELGLVVASATIIGVVGRLARWLPLSGRIALRDASRNRTAAAPAVAAVMASVIGAMAAAVGTASADAHNRHGYLPVLPQRDAYVRVSTHPGDVHAVTAALRRAAPSTPVTTIDTIANDCSRSALPSCVDVTAAYPGRYGHAMHVPGWGSAFSDVLVDDGSGIDRIVGHSDPAAAAALRAGRVLVTDPAVLRSGKVLLELDAALASGRGIHRMITAPATALTSGFRGFQLVLPPSVVERLGESVGPDGVLATTDHGLSSAQRQRLAASLAVLGAPLSVYAEHGYHDPSLWLPLAMVGAASLIAVIAALIATALANVDSRPDLEVLGAVGASPGTRRVLSFSRAAVIAGIGTVVGTIAGILPARAWAHAVGAPLVIPWPAVAAAVVGIPMIAACLGGLFTRARI